MRLERARRWRRRTDEEFLKFKGKGKGLKGKGAEPHATVGQEEEEEVNLPSIPEEDEEI